MRTDLTWRVDPVAARKLMQFGHPFIYAGLAFWLFGSMDRWLLATMSTVEEVGIYSVAHRFASVILFVSLAFGQASGVRWPSRSWPIIRRTIAPSMLDILLALLCAMTSLGGGIALFAPELVAWLMPVEYHGAGPALAALALGLILQSSMQVTALGISIEKKTYLFARLSWMAAVLNLVLNLLMIPSLGALGAAVATSLSYLFLTAAYLYYTQHLHPLPIPWRKLQVLAVMWLSIAVCLVGLRLELPAATSMAWRASLMFGCLLICVSLFPWRRKLNVEPSTS